MRTTSRDSRIVTRRPTGQNARSHTGGPHEHALDLVDAGTIVGYGIAGVAAHVSEAGTPDPTGLPAAGDVVDLTIADVAYRGAGVARLDGWVVFVPGALTGERVRVRIARRRRQYGQGELLEVLAPSPHRLAPACALSAACPGCCYQPVAYAEELRLKQSQLMQALQHRARVPAERFLPPLASPHELGYRNKIVLHGRARGTVPVLGYIGADNASILDVPACPLAMAPLNEALARLRADERFMRRLHPDRPVTLRCTQADGALHWVGHADPRAAWLRAAWLREATALGELRVPRGGFFQVNPGAAERLLATVRAWLAEVKPRTVADLYCGVGVFALAAARDGAGAVVGVDSDDAGIRAARENASAQGLSITFHSGATEARIEAVLAAQDRNAGLVIVDPPRAGLTGAVTASLARLGPAHVLYVSCAADTLARDLGLLADAYQVVRVQMVDLFPRTPYFETAVLLTRVANPAG